MRTSARITGVVILFLLGVTICIWYAAIREDRGGMLTVSFLDVGQGEAIFIDSPSGRQVLIDGGPASGGILRLLGKAMPFYDRSIDVVVATEPDANYSAGLIDVLKRYDVSYIFQPSVQTGTPSQAALEDAIAGEAQKGLKVETAMRGQVINLGTGAYLEILFPDRALPDSDADTACTIMRLVYGKTSFVFSCTAPQPVENYLASLDGTSLKSNVLSISGDDSQLFVGFVSPQFAVGPSCDPTASTSPVFSNLGIQTLDTCAGTVTFISDGQTVMRE